MRALGIVTVTVVGDELEAEAQCRLLRANAIRSAYRSTDPAAGAGTLGGWAIAGPTEIMVGERDRAAARALLPHR